MTAVLDRPDYCHAGECLGVAGDSTKHWVAAHQWPPSFIGHFIHTACGLTITSLEPGTKADVTCEDCR